ncbi:histone H3.v1-like [Lucilia sericata]|uniref:histone H3.v1-like n=1 Tax=Lucilia sericata TaxID=13632 RepID=UPI0018A818A0|nr:histone H3.v1-like [Lucilia sericata]
MSYYRDLNKELIEQVQTMRINMKLYCDEIIQLKGELMEKHESSVILRKECYNWAVENFIHLIQTVQPDSDILPVLQKYVPSRERQVTTSRTLTTSRTPRISRISSDSGERSTGSSRRRSSQLTAEFQRSNSILNSRKSVCSTSPIRRSSNSSREEEEVEEPNEEEEVENVEESQTIAEKEPTEPEVTENLNEDEEEQAEEEPLNIIYEDSEETEEEDNNPEELTDDENNIESMYESVEEITVADNTISTTRRSTLKDVTNMVLVSTTQNSSKDNNSPHKTIRKRGRPRKNKTNKNSFDQENTTDSEMESTVTDRGDRAALHYTRSADQSETLQEPRNCDVRHISLRNKSIPITQAFDLSAEDDYTDMTLGNFKDAACSTPNSRRNSFRKPAKPSTITTNQAATESESGSTTSDCSTRRPSRQCKPKDLAEPKIGVKLRNESKAKSLGKSKVKSMGKSTKKSDTKK